MLQISIVARDTVIAGRELSIAVDVTATREIEVKGIDLQLYGVEGWAFGYNERYRKTFTDTHVELAGATTNRWP